MTGLYIGLMSGTSMDAVDAVLVDFHQRTPRLLASASEPIPSELRRTLTDSVSGRGKGLAQLGTLDIEFGRRFAAACRTVIEAAGVAPVDVHAIGSHGQTIQHRPDGDPPFTLQIGDPNTIAELTGITTVADFRRRDMAAGGQGAPLTPGFHAAVFRSNRVDRVVLNIGGIANITLLPADPSRLVTGYDTGPGNALMDAWSARHQSVSMDTGGRWAASGTIDMKLLRRMQADPYFQRPPPKSTGREYFDLTWLERLLRKHGKRMYRKNVQATLCELTATTIADAIRTHAVRAEEILVCGGGAYNLALMFRLQSLLDSSRVCSTEDFGFAPDWIEAIAFAWLAKQTLEGKAGNLTAVTGARHPVVLGAVYHR